MVMTLKDLIKEILRYQGGEILEHDDDYIWVRSDGNILIYKLVEDKIVEEVDVIAFHQSMKQINGSKVIICAKGVKDSAIALAKKFQISIINQDELASIIGEYMIEKLTSGDEISFEEEEEQEEEEEEIEEESEDRDTIPIILEDTSDTPEKIIKMSFTKEDVLKEVRHTLKAPRAELQLIPYYLFDYSLRIVFEGDFKEQSVSGIIAINGITGKPEIWKEGYETEHAPDISSLRTEPKIHVDEAKKISRNGLIKEYTTEKEVVVENENVTIIEKRKTKPLENSVKISYLGLYYLPVWDVFGINGHIIFNAANGAKIKEEIKNDFTF